MTSDHIIELALLIASRAQRKALALPEPDEDHEDEVFDDDWSLAPRRHFSGHPFLKYPCGDS